MTGDVMGQDPTVAVEDRASCRRHLDRTQPVVTGPGIELARPVQLQTGQRAEKRDSRHDHTDAGAE